VGKQLSEALIRGAHYMYICLFRYGTVSKEDTPTSLVYCWYKYLEMHLKLLNV